MATQQTRPSSNGPVSASTPAKSSGGVLPIPAAALNKASSNAMSRTTARAPASRLKLILRRLPPGLTRDEFVSALGDDWKVGAGKIDWLAYKEGKISKDPSKHSRPARAYVRVKEQSLINLLSERVRQTAFQDSKNSTNDPCLAGAPSLEFAPYNRVPGGKLRKDGRQGTIDQDPEFIEFLQSLTEPITKPPVNGDATEEAKVDKVTTTPLVQYIKEKKANKAKEKAEKAAEKSAKAQKEKEAKESKSEKAESKKVSLMKKEKEDSKSAAKQAQLEKATKEAVKAASKQAATVKSKEQVSKTPETPTAKETTSPSPAKRERERGSAKSVIQTLQRDLAQAASPRLERRAKAAKDLSSSASSKGKEASPARQPATATITQPTTAKPASRVASPAPKAPAPTGPKNARPMPASSQSKTTPKPSTAKAAPAPSPGAKSAFLKHANPSQGITEALLQDVFSTFGAITKCEIDKRKGFGYVDFAEHEGLKAAMAASPVRVGDKGGSVVVLEKRGGPSSTSNTKAATSSPSAKATATPSVPSNPALSPAPTSEDPTATANQASDVPTPTASPTTASSPAPPSGPKAATTNIRGGQGGRGGGRGGFGPGGRGRASFRGRGGVRGSANAASTGNGNAAAPAGGSTQGGIGASGSEAAGKQ